MGWPGPPKIFKNQRFRFIKILFCLFFITDTLKFFFLWKGEKMPGHGNETRTELVEAESRLPESNLMDAKCIESLLGSTQSG